MEADPSSSIYRVRLTKEELLALPREEAILLLSLGQLANETTILAKLFRICSNSIPDEKELTQKAQVTQSVLLGRILTGKLHEGWRIVRDQYLATKLSEVYAPLLDQEAISALRRIKHYFSKKNAVTLVRNNFAFHYSAKSFAKGLDICPDSEELDIFLASTNANSLFYASEAIMSHALFHLIEPSKPELALGKLIDETSKVSGWLSEFMGGCILAIVNKRIAATPDELNMEQIPLPVGPDLEEVRIPFFVQE